MNIRYKTIRRIIITGPVHDRDYAMDYATDNNYTFFPYSGPMPLGKGKVDVFRFKMIAEKVVK